MRGGKGKGVFLSESGEGVPPAASIVTKSPTPIYIIPGYGLPEIRHPPGDQTKPGAGHQTRPEAMPYTLPEASPEAWQNPGGIPSNASPETIQPERRSTKPVKPPGDAHPETYPHTPTQARESPYKPGDTPGLYGYLIPRPEAIQHPPGIQKASRKSLIFPGFTKTA